jgi:hypothetical protein
LVTRANLASAHIGIAKGTGAEQLMFASVIRRCSLLF